MAGTAAPTTTTNTGTQQPDINTLNSILQDKQMAEGAGVGTSNFNTAHTAATSDYNTLKQAGIDPTQFQNMDASALKSYINSNYHPQTGTTGSTGTGQSSTSGFPTINTNLAQTMINAVKNPQQGPSSSEYSVLNGEKLPQYQGRTFTTLDDIAKQTGVQYKKDPVTGAITINGNTINPTGYDKNGNPIVYVRQFLTAAGVPDENITYDDKTRQISYAAPQQQQSMYQSPLAGLLGSMPQAPQIQPYQAPDLSSYYANLMPVQQQFNPDWNGYYNQAHNVYDPLSQTQIKTLMNKQGMDINKADEGLNAKGIFNSGIAVQMENQIRANTNDQVAKVLMTAQSNMAKYAQQLYNDAYTQWNQGNANALKNNQMWLTQAMDQQKQSFTQWLDTQQLNQTQYKNALAAWDNVANLAMKDAQFQATQNMDMYKFNNLSADQSATLAQNQQKMMLPYTMGPTPAQMLPYQYETANNAANNALKQYQFNNMSANQQAVNQLDWAKLNETIRNNQANETLKATQLMGVDPYGRQTLDMQKYNEMVQNDNAKMQISIQNAQNNQDRTQLTRLEDQANQINDDIKNYISSHDMSQKTNQDAVDKLLTQKKTVMDNFDAMGGTFSQYSGSKTPLSANTMNSLISQALKITGVQATQANINAIMNIAQHESSLEPGAYNPNPVRTANGDEHATGLMQTLPNTFNSNKISGYDDINNPLDNMVAAIRYMNSTYGSPEAAWTFWQQNNAY